MPCPFTPESGHRGYGWNVRFVPKADIVPVVLHEEEASN